jgi:hypothetical protein
MVATYVGMVRGASTTVSPYPSGTYLSLFHEVYSRIFHGKYLTSCNFENLLESSKNASLFQQYHPLVGQLSPSISYTPLEHQWQPLLREPY